jgi:hypothetical protein
MVNIVPLLEIACWLATAATTVLPAPAKSAAESVSEPPDVSNGNRIPVADTAEASDPPDAVGFEYPPRAVIDKAPLMMQSPSTYIRIPLPGWSVVSVTLALMVRSLKFATTISPSYEPFLLGTVNA